MRTRAKALNDDKGGGLEEGSGLEEGRLLVSRKVGGTLAVGPLVAATLASPLLAAKLRPT